MAWYDSFVGGAKKVAKAAGVSNLKEAALTAATGGAYLSNKSPIVKRAQRYAKGAKIPVISDAAAAGLKGQAALEHLAGRTVKRKASRRPKTQRHRVRKAELVLTLGADGRTKGNMAKKSRVPAMRVPTGSQKGDALATAGRLIASLGSSDPRLAAYAKGVMNATAKRARGGDTAAQRAVSFIKAAQSANKSKGVLTGFLVTNAGRVVIGKFVQTG